jgi:hypothetical protein
MPPTRRQSSKPANYWRCRQVRRFNRTRCLADRISEARINGWLGEVEGLQVGLTAARGKLAALDKTANSQGQRPRLR